MQGSRQFSAQLSNLDEMMHWVREIIKKYVLDEKAKKFELAVEEALVNVIHYAYVDYPPGLVELVYIKSKDRLDLVIKDQGSEFNPIDNPKSFDKEAPLEERDIGGLGIHFILTMTDCATYQRVNGWNVLTLSSFST